MESPFLFLFSVATLHIPDNKKASGYAGFYRLMVELNTHLTAQNLLHFYFNLLVREVLAK